MPLVDMKIISSDVYCALLAKIMLSMWCELWYNARQVQMRIVKICRNHIIYTKS